jgi:NodT family efflux transporter outer membrane factor (OMF) lipoprotein
MPEFRRLRALPLAVVTAVISACAVGPDHVRPDVPVGARFARDVPPAGGESATPRAATPAPDAEFWTGFADPTLTRLVEAALLANHDLRIALARYDAANALAREAGFDRFPTVTASATASDSRVSADQLPGAARQERDSDSYSGSIVAAWELDLFGRVRRNVEATRADTRAGALDLAALQVIIAGEVARSYLELRGLQERLRVARENADNQRETLELVEVRLAAGRGTDFDSSRARAQLETTLSRVPALEASVAVTQHRLAVLTGNAPGALIAELDARVPLPALPAGLDPSTPGDLLRRRPDVAAAEERLHAATARIGVATADLFPRFTLAGLIGTQAFDSSALFERDSETRLVALGVDWSFLDVGRVRARIAAADADAAGALARYEQAVLLALEDTENALVLLAHARLEDQHLERAAVDSARAAQLARVRFDAGAADLLDVLDAERSQLAAQDAFADARTRTATALVGLYRALAGGWPTRAPQRIQVSAR